MRWITEAAHGHLTCPSCGVGIARRPVPVAPLACGACGAHFFEGLPVADYVHSVPGQDAALLLQKAGTDVAQARRWMRAVRRSARRARRAGRPAQAAALFWASLDGEVLAQQVLGDWADARELSELSRMCPLTSGGPPAAG